MWHPNLKFTVETGGKQIPFLDIQIDIRNQKIQTSVYGKPTYTSLILNYVATCPSKWKSGLIQTLLNRAYVVCNSWYSFHLELDNRRKIFRMNGYPSTYIELAIRKFLNKKLEPNDER